MLALLTALARAAEQALRIWAVNASYNLTRRIEADIEADENQIAALRARGDDAAQRTADRLRDRVIRAQGIAANLSTPSAPAPSGSANPDTGGSVHPAD